uniref:Uncharacterized protein n=1 Tax=Rhizophora mucronata TaxID=61149 RepID=A0A2P2Q3H4_RHIMU
MTSKTLPTLSIPKPPLSTTSIWLLFLSPRDCSTTLSPALI